MRALIPLSAVTCLVLIVLSALIGSAPLSVSETFSALFGQGNDAALIIVWEIRMPRAVAAFLVGAALGLAGAGLQGLLQNPLAGPGVLGVSAFATLGAVIAIYFGLAAWSNWSVPMAAIVFAGLAVAVLLLAAGRGAGTVTIILIGIGLSAFAGALTSLALNLAPNPYALSDLINWLLGSVANRSWPDIAFVVPALLVGGVLVLRAGPGLRALGLGEETAASLGADPARIRFLIILGTALLAGGSVALAGTIGFVGMVAPHIVRPFVKHDPKSLLIPSALAAGAMLLAADIVIRVLPFATELKLGVAAALIGAPVFIWIASRLAAHSGEA